MPKFKKSIGVVSKCYLCAALQCGMKMELKCSVVEREAIRSGEKKNCKHVKLEMEKSSERHR